AGVRGFHVAGGGEPAGVMPERGHSGSDVGKLLAQKFILVELAVAVHVNADQHRIVAGDEQQLAVIIARRAVKEFCKTHLYSPAPAHSPSRIRAAGADVGPSFSRSIGE